MSYKAQSFNSGLSGLDYRGYWLFGSNCRCNLAGLIPSNSVVEFCNVSYF